MKKHIRALIIDDNPVDCVRLEGLLHQLSRWEVAVRSCATGQEAMLLLRQEDVDVVFVDHLLEEEKGTEIIQLLRQEGHGAGLVLCTAMGGEDAVVEALRAGADDYLRKDELSIENLSRCLHHTMAKVESLRTLELACDSLMESKEQLEARVRERTAALSQAHEQLNIITSSANDAIIMLDSGGRVVFWNTAAEKIFGYLAEQIIGRDMHMYLAPQENQQAIAEGFRFFRHTGDGPLVGKVTEVTAIHANGHRFPIEVSISAIRMQGDEWYAVGMVRDITERKHAEEALRRAKEEAEHATQLKDKFVSLVAHDLRGPFTTILGFLNLLENDTECPVSSKQKFLLDWVIDSSQKLLQMIDEILDISRLKTGKLVPAPRFVNARYLVEKAVDTLRPLAERKGIRMENRVDEDQRLFADPNLVGEVLHNLLSNAVKFCRDGDGVEIITPQEGGVTLAVKDTGVGISTERLAKIFRLEEKTTTMGTAGEQGTGFGLPFSLDIMRAHGGDLTAISEVGAPERPGGGSTFFIHLPEVIPQVLLVDDDPDIRRLLFHHMRKIGANPWEAATVNEALEMLERETMHLVICDLILPEKDGFALLEELRGNPRTAPIPAIVITADDTIEAREKAFQMGANDFVTKPIELNEFLPRVRHFVS